MKILLLGPNRGGLAEYMILCGDLVEQTEENINGIAGLDHKFDFLVSYGYRHILKPELVARFPNRIVNLHVSYLPWNRGADPNIWSFLEDTPKGVTIHYIDSGIDTGNILAQRRVVMTTEDTLKTSYEKLSAEIEKLLREVWPEIRLGKLASKPQIGNGSSHKTKELERFKALLPYGWDTPVSGLVGMALAMRNESSYVC